MAVTITSVTGIGPFISGPGGIFIPSSFRVEGTATGCERVRVTSECSNSIVEVDVQAGVWGAVLKNDFPNNPDCQCGGKMTVDVTCIIGTPAGDSFGTSALPCDPTTTTSTTTSTTTTIPPSCPAITVDPPSVSGTCVSGKRAVSLTSHISQPTGQNAFLQWDYGDGSLGPAFFVIGSTPAAGITEPPHDYSPGTYTAKLKTAYPPNCPDFTVQVVVPPCTCAQQIQNITFSEGPCDAQGNRQVTATAQPVAGGPAIGSYLWGWDNGPQSTPGGATSPSQTFAGGSTHSVQLTAQTGGCSQQMSVPYTVGPCPTQPTTPTTGTTPTTPTTGTTPTTPTTGTTPTTPTTPTTQTTSPPTGGLGCICALLLIAALALIAIASISFMAWGCSGFVSPAMLSIAIGSAILGIVVLIIWMLVCRDCPAILALINTFTVLVAAMPILAGVLALLGLFGCAAGALANWILFAIVLAVLLLFARSIGCIKPKG